MGEGYTYSYFNPSPQQLSRVMLWYCISTLDSIALGRGLEPLREHFLVYKTLLAIYHIASPCSFTNFDNPVTFYSNPIPSLLVCNLRLYCHKKMLILTFPARLSVFQGCVYIAVRTLNKIFTYLTLQRYNLFLNYQIFYDYFN